MMGYILNRVKRFVKQITGIGSTRTVAFDRVARTKEGFYVVGWLLASDVSALKAVPLNVGEELSQELTYHPREDAEYDTGGKVLGFQLRLKTKLDIRDLIIEASYRNGRVATYALSLTDNALQEVETSSKAVSSTTSASYKGACEFVIYSDSHMYVGGWIMSDSQPSSVSVMLSDKETRLTTGYEILRYHRDDVFNAFEASAESRNAGYMILFERDPRENTLNIDKTNIEITFTFGKDETAIPITEKYLATDNRMVNAKRLLNQWLPHSPQHLKKHTIYTPMLQAIFRQAKAPSMQRFDFNRALLTSPLRASIIIPLYGRYDFMRYQLSYFARMGTYTDCEVLYVIDDPKIAPHALKLAKEMAIITQQPFSLLQLSENVGFGRANNIGASKASADNLVLLNSDILPKTPDWLDRMLETLGDDNTGIVGARLLFEDESLQHDGMAPMRVADYPGLLFNDHPRKGWPAELSPVTDAVVTCPLLTAACWAIKKADYDAMGGFDPAYILGDFEDSDLCLRLIAAGKTNVLRRDAVLYHLERQSQNLVEAGRWKHNITILNAIHFNEKWKAQLETLETQGAAGV